MKTMLAAYLPGNSTVDLREVAVPTPGINQVLIKMKILRDLRKRCPLYLSSTPCHSGGTR